MSRKKDKKEEQNTEPLELPMGIMENLARDVAHFINAWRPAISRTEEGCVDFSIGRLRAALGLYRYPDGLDVFGEARRRLEEQGYAFQSFCGQPTLFVCPVDSGITINAETAVEVP